MWSNRLVLVGAALSIIGIIVTWYMSLAPAQQAWAPDWVPTLVFFLTALTSIGTPILRVIKQTNLHTDDTDDAGA